jgi:DNA polymerase
MLQIVQEHQVLAADDAAHVLYVDVETRSPASLRDLGVDRYVRDNRTEVICLGFAHNNDEPKIWTPTNPAIPCEFEQASCNTHWSLRAHNAPFEIAVFEHILKPRFGFPTIPLTRWRCTMAQALACGLPGKLQRLADALECAFRKDTGGTRLMFQMARPRRARKGENASNPLYFDDADRLQRLHDYCVEDIRVTREIDARLPQLSDTEQQVWQLSCKINDRGFCVDRKLAEPARQIAQTSAPENNKEIAEITGGDVTSINQVAKLVAWVQAQVAT